MTKKTTEVPTNDLRALFDIATESMDFGSGFLDDDEVAVLRRVAVLIGVDPMVGTPRPYVKKYPHTMDAVEKPVYDWNIADPYRRMNAVGVKTVCRYCGEGADHIVHGAEG